MPESRPIHILYVEADAGAARLLQKRLCHAGYKVDLARDGFEGLKAWESGSYDLLATDQDMPGMSGLDLIRILAARGPLPPTVMITGAGNEFIAVEAMKIGADDYIIKDIDALYLDLIPAVIERALEKKRLEQEKQKAEVALRQSEERYRKLVELAPYGIAVHSEGRISFVNEVAVSILGASSPEELVGKPVIDFVHPDSRPLASQRIASMLEQGVRTSLIEEKFLRVDGRPIDVEVAASPLNYGGSRAILVVFRDISDRKRSEAALRESEEKYRTLVENANDAIIVSQEGILKFANTKCCELSGYSMRELTSIPVANLLHPEDRDLVVQNQVRRLRGEQIPSNYSFRVMHRDGSVRWVEITAAAITWDGKPAALAFMSDITDRKRAEEERLRLVTAIEQAAEAIVMTDTDGVIVYVNPAFERITGYSRHEAISESPGIVKSGHHDEAFYKQMWDTISSGRVWRGHFINKKKDGTLFEEEATISPVKNASGEIVNYVAVKRDVTNEVLLESQLLQAQRMEAIGTLAGGIAHDFNNLLQVIQGYSDMALIEVSEGQPLHTELREIRRAARNAAELTRGLLTFSRQMETRLRPVNLNHEIRQVAKILDRTIPKNIGVLLNLGEPLATVNADSAHIQQVVMNLALNGRDAMPEGGKLVIETRTAVLDEDYCKSHLESTPGKYVVLSISDTGSGMAKGILDRIFEPFFTTKEPGKGTGLGLSIAYGIVKKHGGHILCYSEPGEGATFKVYLPCADEETETVDFIETRSVRGGHETILMVDDEEPLIRLGKQILIRFGYQVLTATNGEEALDVYRKNRHTISLIILDLIMPGMSGDECLIEIMKIDPEAKVIIASGYAANGRAERALEIGAGRFLRKPYEARPLLETIREMLDEG